MLSKIKNLFKKCAHEYATSDKSTIFFSNGTLETTYKIYCVKCQLDTQLNRSQSVKILKYDPATGENL